MDGMNLEYKGQKRTEGVIVMEYSQNQLLQMAAVW